jgi:DNA-binding transcriptional ArsR family regulator
VARDGWSSASCARGWTLTATAEAADVSLRCARKWVVRYREQGEVGLADRSSAPHLVANRTPPDRVAAIIALRRLRFTAAEIAEALGMALSTVSGILTRLGLGRLGRLGLEAARRYERSRPGELVHVDVKKLGRIEGGVGKRVRGGVRAHYTGSRTDREGTRRTWLVGARAHRDRRLLPARLRGGAAGWRMPSVRQASAWIAGVPDREYQPARVPHLEVRFPRARPSLTGEGGERPETFL